MRAARRAVGGANAPGSGFRNHDHKARIRRLRAGLVESEASHLLISRPVSLRYLVGFTGSSGYLLVGPETLHFVTDGRYDEQCRTELALAGIDAEVSITGVDGLSGRLSDVVSEVEAEVIGLESAGVTWAFAMDVSSWFDGVDVVPCKSNVEDLRMAKDQSEIERLSAAAAIGDLGFEYLLERLEPGVTEHEVSRDLERFMVDAGASGVSFDSIVASGPRGAMPHATPGEYELESGQLIVLDFGCRVDGYCSDMTRTVALGAPPVVLDRVYAEVAVAQALGVAAALNGRSTGEVDAACRTSIEAAGYGDEFAHSTGHGVGLEVHEEPRVARDGTAILEDGYVITVEPGIYLPGVGGVRIEDMVVIDGDKPTVLTKSPKELTIL